MRRPQTEPRPLGERRRRGSSTPRATGALRLRRRRLGPHRRLVAGRPSTSCRRCHAFLPNASEAMAYTRTDTPRDALYALADRVPLAVVTNGAHGALAIDSATGEEAQVPALRVPALDPTGAGDVFGAGMVLGTLAGWPLADRLAFAALCSGAGGAAVRRLAGRARLGRHRRLVARGARRAAARRLRTARCAAATRSSTSSCPDACRSAPAPGGRDHRPACRRGGDPVRPPVQATPYHPEGDADPRTTLPRDEPRHRPDRRSASCSPRAACAPGSNDASAPTTPKPAQVTTDAGEARQGHADRLGPGGPRRPGRPR